MLKFSLCLAAALISAAAAAKEPITIEGGNTARVVHADLNLAGAAGRKTLEARIRRAAKKLCVDDRVVGLEQAMFGRACVEEAIASAAPQIEVVVASAGKGGAKDLVLGLRR